MPLRARRLEFLAPDEDYVPPVGFAREPREERRRWFGRFLTALFVVFILWLGWSRVINPPEDNPVIPRNPNPPVVETSLPSR